MTKQTQQPKPDQQNKPVKIFRLRGVKVAVFENRAKVNEQETAFYKTAIQRIYREGEEWKTTTSLGRDDLPVARMLLQRVWEWILESEAQERHEEKEAQS